MTKKILVFVLIVVVIGLIIYFVSKQGKPEEEVPQTLGETLYQGVGTTNPAENLPELNPFEAGSVNPYSNGYKNPFGQ